MSTRAGDAEEEDRFNDWDEYEDEEAGLVFKSFLDDSIFSTARDLIAYDRDTYGFDLLEIVNNSDKEYETLLRIINFVRWRVMDMKALAEESIMTREHAIVVNEIQKELRAKEYFASERYMKPALANDALLLNPERYLNSSAKFEGDSDDDEAKPRNLSISELKVQLSQYKALVAELTSGEEPRPACDSSDDEEEEGYFASYGHVGIHETMLKDDTRTQAYASAIETPLLKDKIVLDVGCGSGILSLLAARAGAKRVIGIDNSKIINMARKIVDKNGYSGVITLVRGPIESSPLPLQENEKVDIIVSEWMGYGLYFENMLASVFAARDKYLSPTGVMMPSTARVFLQAVSSLAEKAEVDRVGWWKNVYGFDMSDMQPLVTSEAQVQVVNPSSCFSNRALVHSLDTKTASDADLDFVVPFKLVSEQPAAFHAFAVTFDVIFDSLGAPAVELSTSLETPATHWQHVALWVQPEYRREMNKGDVIVGEMQYTRRGLDAKSQRRREYDITMRWSIAALGSDQSIRPSRAFRHEQKFLLA